MLYNDFDLVLAVDEENDRSDTLPWGKTVFPHKI